VRFGGPARKCIDGTERAKDMLTEYQTAKPKVAETVSKVSSRDEVELLMEKARSGEALLRVIAYPWGVELDVCEPST